MGHSSMHKIFRCFSMILIMIFLIEGQGETLIFNVKDFGAVGDGKTDDTKAFVEAWNVACDSNEMAEVIVPNGTYLMGPVTFSGPCKGPIEFHNEGLIKATQYATVNSDCWINFKYLDGLVIDGGGSFDGQGPHSPSLLSVTDLHSSNRPASLVFTFMSNSRVELIKSLNSKGSHMKLYSCSNMILDHITIVAPASSPNTDGINIGWSANIQVLNSRISTGDDCVSILPGSTNINISAIFCGPGHGISVGSLGAQPSEAAVDGVIVRNSNFSNTENGVRIKTWATKYPAKATNITFENIYIDHSSNPIIIDQHYCPSHYCHEGESHVQISDVKYINIWGVSKSQVAVNLQCSASNPCRGIEARDINLSYRGPKGPATSSCSNVEGTASGLQIPPSCIH